MAKFNEAVFELLHHSPYFLNSASSDYVPFPNLKKWLILMRFRLNDDFLLRENIFGNSTNLIIWKESTNVRDVETYWTKIKRGYVEKYDVIGRQTSVFSFTQQVEVLFTYPRRMPKSFYSDDTYDSCHAVFHHIFWRHRIRENLCCAVSQL